MKSEAIAALALAALLPLAAQAATPAGSDDEGRLYGVAGFGTVNVDLGDLEKYYEALADGYTAMGATRSDVNTDDGGRAFGFGFGYWLHPSLAVEGYFRDFGRPSAGFTASYPGGGARSESTDYHASGLGVAVLGLLPVGEWLSVYGRVDVVNMRTEYETLTRASSTSIAFDSGDDSGVQTGFGLGGQYDFRHGVSLRMDWQRIEFPLGQRGLSADTTFDSVNLFLVKGL
jgi:hypothetical protein